MKKPKVIVEGIDRIIWLNEKSNNTLKHLSRLYELTETLEIEKIEKEKIKYELDNAIHDFLKVFLCLHGHPNGYQSEEFVNSQEKYLQLLENYNINSSEMSKRNKAKSDTENYLKIDSLLNVDERFNRDKVNEILNNIYITNDGFTRLNKLLDECNLGSLDWASFCLKAKKELQLQIKYLSEINQ